MAYYRRKTSSNYSRAKKAPARRPKTYRKTRRAPAQQTVRIVLDTGAINAAPVNPVTGMNQTRRRVLGS